MNALNLVKQSLLVALLYSFGTLGGTIAQELPICTHQYYDADGDGFGWQNEASCLITSSSEPPPSFTNKSTGEPVTLVRPYWDGNTDIANRAIRCDRYDYQQASGDYQRPTDSFNTLPDLILTHQSISTSRKYTPFVGSDQDQEYYGWYTLDREGVELLYDSSLQTFGMPLWRTNDGLYENERYSQNSELLQAPYIEIVNPQGVRAIRIWFNEGDRFNTAYDFIDNIHNTEGYFQCYDESGADFGPTGQIGTPSATPEPALQELALSGQSNDWYESDGVVNLATGEPVPLVKANWNYNNDIAGRLIQCDEYGFDPVCNSAGYGKGCGFAAVEPLYYMMPWHLTDSTSNHGANLHWWSRFSGVRNNRKFGYSDGSITPGIEQARIPIFLRTELVELLNDNKVRIWQEATDNGHEKYHECTVYPTGTADSATTSTESTSTASDGSNNQTDGSNTQTSGSDSNTQTEENNPSETSDTTNTSMTLPENTQANDETSSVTSGNSGGGSIDTWIMFLLLSVLGLNVSRIVEMTK